MSNPNESGERIVDRTELVARLKEFGAEDPVAIEDLTLWQKQQESLVDSSVDRMIAQIKASFELVKLLEEAQLRVQANASISDTLFAAANCGDGELFNEVYYFATEQLDWSDDRVNEAVNQ